MNSHSHQILLSADDPAPTRVINPHGTSPFLLIGDHAGNMVPTRLNALGLPEHELARHIGWDIGVGGVGELLATTLDAVFIRQTYSRLVIDCNRDPAAVDAIPPVSDGTPVPANQHLAPADRAARVAAIHAPYQDAIADELKRRDAAGQPTILVSLHSFTQIMQGVARPWHIGVLYAGGEARFARAVLHLLAQRDGPPPGDNQPYAMDGIDYTIPRHAFDAGRNYVEIEIRQDLLATPDQQAEWADVLAAVLAAARAACDG